MKEKEINVRKQSTEMENGKKIYTRKYGRERKKTERSIKTKEMKLSS